MSSPMPWTVLQPHTDAASIARTNSKITLFNIVLAPLSKSSLDEILLTKLRVIIPSARTLDNRHCWVLPGVEGASPKWAWL